MDWIVKHAQELRSGIWPGDMFYEYVEFRGKRVSCRASFENTCLVIDELDTRVQHCGLDGYLVEEKMNGNNEKEIAQKRWLSENFVRRHINKVLNYCASGDVVPWIATHYRKGQTYEEWKRGRRP